MIRLKEIVVTSELKKAWKTATAPAAKAALADFKGWPLYQHVGEPWPQAPRRFTRVPSLSAVAKGLKSSATESLERAANPGLKAMYMNLSMLLNVRQQFFHDEWDSVQDTVWRTTKSALTALTKRENWKPNASEEGFWLYPPNSHLWQHTWEQLHPGALEAPFQEHFLTIFRAGHVPAGLQGKDWKTCQFLYH